MVSWISDGKEYQWTLQLPFHQLISHDVQDLTARDIRLYTADQLKSHFKSNPSQINRWEKFDLISIVDMVCRKADGVFLWIALALRMLLRGLTKDDATADLQRRLDLLPADLDSLYRDMWNRLNDDQQIYRQEVAQIFNAAIDAIESPMNLWMKALCCH